MKMYAPLNTEPAPLLMQIEVVTFFQLPSFHIVGLPGPEVAEAKERIRAAIETSGLTFPRGRIVVNLSPSSIRKKGTGLDLGMALAVLSCSLKIEARVAAWGELGLDGRVKPVGQLTRTLSAAWTEGLDAVILCESEISHAQTALRILEAGGTWLNPPPLLIPVKDLQEAWEVLSNWKSKEELKKVPQYFARDTAENSVHVGVLQSPVSLRSQEQVSSLLPLSPALERMAGMIVAGRHHFLVLGPRGTGKSHFIEWLIALQPSLLPKDQLSQMLLFELAQISNSMSAPKDISDLTQVRWISSRVRPSALIGGCNAGVVRPGEYSLAQGGSLVADEILEWDRDSRESLREPLERRKVSITRAQGSVELPAEFQLMATGNLCPCGGWPATLPRVTPLNLPPLSLDEEGHNLSSLPACRCSNVASSAYLARLSGPILDRIDCVVVWAALQNADASSNVNLKLESVKGQFEGLQNRVRDTQNFCIEQWGKLPGLLSGAEVEEIIEQKVTSIWPKVLELRGRHGASSLSLRSRHKIARISMSLAAWDRVKEPTLNHWLEASFYRPESLNSF